MYGPWVRVPAESPLRFTTRHFGGFFLVEWNVEDFNKNEFPALKSDIASHADTFSMDDLSETDRIKRLHFSRCVCPFNI